MAPIQTDSVEEKRHLTTRLINGLPHIYIPSYNRWGGVSTLDRCPLLVPWVTLVVEERQAVEYDLAYPDIRQVVIPENYAGYPSSIGRARRFILEMAPEDHIIMLDDDLVDGRLMASTETGVTTRVLSDLSPEQRIFDLMHLFTEVMVEAYDANPRAVSGAPQSDVGFVKTFPAESVTKWRLNTQDPYFCISFRIDRYREQVGYELDLGRWGVGAIGEDKALAMETLLAGSDLVDVPSIIFKAGPTGRAGTTIPRSRAVFEKASTNYLEYADRGVPFTMPRWNEELQIHDSWNIAWGRVDRKAQRLWTE